jgi:hypothetical protein
MHDFDIELFDVPVLLVPHAAPATIGLERVNETLLQIGGHAPVADPDGKPQPMYRALWGGEATTWFCENQIYKYTHSVKLKEVGYVFYTGVRDRKGRRQYLNARGEFTAPFARQEAIINVGRARVFIEEWLHPKDAMKGWDLARWYYYIGQDELSQDEVDALCQKHGVQHPMDLPFEARANLGIRRKDVLGKEPSHGAYEQFVTVQTESGGYKETVDEEVFDIVREHHRLGMEDPDYRNLEPGSALPEEVIAKRIQKKYIAFYQAQRKVEQTSSERLLELVEHYIDKSDKNRLYPVATMRNKVSPTGKVYGALTK